MKFVVDGFVAKARPVTARGLRGLGSLRWWREETTGKCVFKDGMGGLSSWGGIGEIVSIAYSRSSVMWSVGSFDFLVRRSGYAYVNTGEVSTGQVRPAPRLIRRRWFTERLPAVGCRIGGGSLYRLRTCSRESGYCG
jgi:hypothetical protein